MNEEKEEEDSQASRNPDGFWTRLATTLGIRKPGTKEALEHEIHELLEEGEEHGLISPLEEQMIHSILEFRETYASEIMTPAAEIVAFDETAELSELVEMVIESGFTRIPVYRENSDQVIGAVHAKDLLKLCARSDESGEADLQEYLRPVYFISESKPIVDLLREFQKRKIHIAVVTDEFGTVRGLITLEDILEEIVGEIDDEYDEEENDLEIIDECTVHVHGWADIEKIEEYFDCEIPEGSYESVGGLVIYRLGRLGRAGDRLEIDGFSYEVLEATSRQIKLVRIHRIQPGEPADA